MPAFQINDAEWSALVEEPGDIFLTYCAIRRVMDYSTGVAGQARKISEQMLREVLYVAPCRGRHESGSPTRQRIRSVVDRLITLGTLVQIGPMVFQLPLATRDSPSKRSATDEQPDQQPDQQPPTKSLEPSNDGGYGSLEKELATATESGSSAISNLPPESGNHTVPLTRGEEATPTSAGQWCQFFIRERRYQLHVVQTPKTMPLFASWVERGVTTDQMRLAMESAEAKLGSTPDSPLYYRNFLDQLLLETQRLAQQEHRHERDYRSGKPGQGGPHREPGGLAAELLDTSWADHINIPAD